MIPFALSGFYFFYFALIAVYVIFMPKVLHLIGYGYVELSVIMAASPLIRFLSPFLFVKYIQLTPRIFLQAALLTVAAALAVYVTIDHFWALLFVAIVLGFGLSLILPFVEHVALEHIAQESYGKVRLFGSIGFVIVSLVLVRYIDNPYNAIHFLVLVAVMIALFSYIVLKVTHTHYKEEEPRYQGTVATFLKDRYLWISLFLMQLAFIPFYNFFFIHETAHGLSNSMTIYLWSFGVLCEVLMFIFQGPLFQRFTLINLLLFSTAMTVIRWSILYFFPENIPLLALSQSFHAISFGLYHSVAIRYVFTLYEDKKLAQQFFIGISYGLGGLIGTIISGFWYKYSAETIYLFAAAVSLVAWFALLHHKKRRSKA